MGAIRILGEKDVRSLISSETALEVARRTLRDQAGGRSFLSTPSSMRLDTKQFGGGDFKFKAASVGFLGAAGIRLISRLSPTDPNACNYCAVYDHGGVALKGLVAELWISRIRTAAFGVATVELLVNPGPVVAALFGTGKIAQEIVPMLARALPIAELRVKSQRPESMTRFVEANAAWPFALRAEPDGRRMVEGADLVITVTEANSPLVFPGTLKPGAVVCSMGGKNELDYGVLLDAQRLIVDDPDFASEVGDGGAWIAQGRLSKNQFRGRVDALACEVAGEKKPGRLSANDRIVAIAQGMAVGDVAFAIHALREAERLNKGLVVTLPD